MRKPSSHPRSKILNWIWKLKLLPKIKFFLWLVIRGALSTYEFLSIRKMEIPNGCYLCSQNVENIEHVFKISHLFEEFEIKLRIIVSLICYAKVISSLG